MAPRKKSIKKEVISVERIDANAQISNTIARHQKEDRELTASEHIAKALIYKGLDASTFIDMFASNGFYDNGGSGLQILQPDNNPEVVRRVPVENSILNQCIDAMVQNIEGTGFTLEYVGPEEYADEPEKNELVASEKKQIENFLSAPNEKYSFEEMRRRLRRDRETFGYAFIEVLRGLDNEILAIYHCPASNMRITSQYKEPVVETINLRRGDETLKMKRSVRFHRFVSLDAAGLNKTWFKEFGDPRPVDSTNGNTKDGIDLANLATEILMIKDYKPGSLYGWPRWINQKAAITGSNEAALTNVEFFKDNAIPAMAMLISGGTLSQSGVDAIANQATRVRGRQSMNHILVLEAFSDPQSASPEGTMPPPRVELKTLGDARQKDGLFLEYDAACEQKVRSAFRLPPILIGLSEDYSRATAEASMAVCESQVFTPERSSFDEIINKSILGDGTNAPIYWRMKSNPTKIVDKEDIANAISTLEASGALTPNTAIDLANSIFSLKIKRREEAWADFPYSTTLALIQQKQEIVGLQDLIVEFNSGLTQASDSVSNPQDGKTLNALQKFISKLSTGKDE